MIPWYGQSWSVFAPEPINGDYRLKVRAQLVDGTVTEWVSATDAEQSLSHHNLFPPRAANLGVKQASLLKAAWGKLSPEQQQIAELNYFKEDNWLGRMREDMAAIGDDPAVASYIAQERFACAYATQVARTMWGDEVGKVQYSVSRQNVIPFAERNDPDAERPLEQVVPTGWRGLIAFNDQSERHFSEVFLAANRNQNW